MGLINLLPKDDIFISTEGIKIRNLNGINNTGSREHKGTYYFSEQINNQSCKYILLQDALGRIVVRGVVITDGIVIRATGFGRGRLNSKKMERFITDLVAGFLGCEQYFGVGRG